jgi:hypothetical protein
MYCYFLMNLANNSMDFSTAMYYEFAAENTLAELQAMDSTGSADVSPNTAAYVAGLPTNYTSDDLPTTAEAEALDVLDITLAATE